MNLSQDWFPVAMVLAGYLLGSIPVGVVVTRCFGAVDPRTAGSRNIGFTNVLRVAGKKAGLLTLAGDVGKGWIIAWSALQLLNGEPWVLAAAASPVLGHLYPIFLTFRGGKGVATALGAIAGIAPLIGVSMLTIWIVTVGMWRYSSGAAIAAFTAFPVMSVALGTGWKFLIFSILVSGIVLFRHKDNAVRLWNGTEPKIGQPITTGVT